MEVINCPDCGERLLVKEVKYASRDTDTANCPECKTVLYSWHNDTEGYALEKLNKTHELKTWKPFFDAVISGDKTFEMRKDDRGFEVGDSLRLIEVDPDKNLEPTGRVAKYKITYILRGEQWGIVPDYAILAIK